MYARVKKKTASIELKVWISGRDSSPDVPTVNGPTSATKSGPSFTGLRELSSGPHLPCHSGS